MCYFFKKISLNREYLVTGTLVNVATAAQL